MLVLIKCARRMVANRIAAADTGLLVRSCVDCDASSKANRFAPPLPYLTAAAPSGCLGVTVSAAACIFYRLPSTFSDVSRVARNHCGVRGAGLETTSGLKTSSASAQLPAACFFQIATNLPLSVARPSACDSRYVPVV